MTLWKIFITEFAYQALKIVTWLYLAVLLVFTIVMNLVTTPGDGVFANNTFYITGIIVIGGVVWLLIGAVIAGEAAARDVQMRMHPLIYTTPVTKLNFLGGRFLAAFVLNTLLILSLPLGVLLSFYLPGMDQGELLPFRPEAYLSVFFLISLPNAFVATGLQFTFAVLSRKVMTSYIASLLLAIFPQIIAMTTAKLFGNWDLLKLLDPVGITGIIGSELGTWTSTEKNTRLIVLEGMFFWNRVLWLSIAIGALLFVYFRFSFAYPITICWLGHFKWEPKVKVKTSAETAIVRATTISVLQVEGNFGFATCFCQTLAIARESFWTVAKNPVGLTLVGAMAIASAVFGDRIMTQFEIPLIPTTQQTLAYLTAPVGNVSTLWVVIPLLIIYFSGELVWSDRDVSLGDITDAMPVPEWVFLAGKLLGLGFIIFAWMILLITGGILMQLGLGYNELEMGLYLQVLFGLQLVDYLLFAQLALVVHVVVNQKYIGCLVMLLVFSFIAFPSTFKVEHSMLIFGKDPGWQYSDMRGFGTTLGPWLWFKAYWIAWGLLLALAARLLWARGREQSLKNRIQVARRRFVRSATRAVIGAAGLIFILGSFLFYNTNVLNQYLTGSDINEQKAEYERRYGRYRNTLQPRLTATKLLVELYPDRQEARIHGTYTLTNKNELPVDSVHISSVSGVALEELKFNRRAVGVLIDQEFNHRIYVLEQSLKPGDSLQLSFEVNYKQRGFLHNGASALVMKNGTCFTNLDLLPSIGYQRLRELNDVVLRKKNNLADRPAIPSLYNSTARKMPFSEDHQTLEAIISTVKGEVAIAPGVLQKSWAKGDRSYFHYDTEVPIGAEYSILSASYAVQKSRWHDVAIRIYHHPKHAQNIGRMLRSLKASLEYYTEQFGPYPYGYITVVERAGNGGGATADAGIIYYGEQYPLMNPDDSQNGFDLPYYILAHEMAHQWWGMARLTPANVEGAGVLIEGLAVYSGMQVLENNYGDGHLRNYLNFLHSSYEMPRSLATAPLLQANEPFLYYRKSGLAMHALSEYIGKEKVNGALRLLLHKHSSGELPLPTTLDLYQEIQKVTPDSLHYLLHDLFKANTYWRLKTEQLAVKQMKSKDWQVTLTVQAQKVVVDSAGHENEVPMNDWLEVGLYGEGKGLNEPIYLRKHRIRSGKQTIKVTVPRKPERGGIDPNYLMIDLRLEDNVKEQ